MIKAPITAFYKLYKPVDAIRDLVEQLGHHDVIEEFDRLKRIKLDMLCRKELELSEKGCTDYAE